MVLSTKSLTGPKPSPPMSSYTAVTDPLPSRPRALSPLTLPPPTVRPGPRSRPAARAGAILPTSLGLGVGFGGLSGFSSFTPKRYSGGLMEDPGRSIYNRDSKKDLDGPGDCFSALVELNSSLRRLSSSSLPETGVELRVKSLLSEEDSDLPSPSGSAASESDSVSVMSAFTDGDRDVDTSVSGKFMPSKSSDSVSVSASTGSEQVTPAPPVPTSTQPKFEMPDEFKAALAAVQAMSMSGINPSSGGYPPYAPYGRSAAVGRTAEPFRVGTGALRSWD